MSGSSATARAVGYVPLPANAEVIGDWPEWDNESRLIAGERQHVGAANIEVRSWASQLADGSIDVSASGGPHICINKIDSDGHACELLTLTVDQARLLATALQTTADQLDEWAGR